MKEVSFLIVTKNRFRELAFTLDKLREWIDLSVHEVLVYIDGCEETEMLRNQYEWVRWYGAEKGIGASPARNFLYKKAEGDIFIGLDDDAHPISKEFVKKVEKVFLGDPNIGIIAFQEVRGVFLSDEEAMKHAKPFNKYFTNDFVGCGFAVKKEVYDSITGFPVWMDIYGEETCVAMEVMELGYDIMYDGSIVVNHRVDKQKRLIQGRNYYRFEKQLKNAFLFYLVYYQYPFKKVAKLIIHNFVKYALQDKRYFVLYFRSVISAFLNIGFILKFRRPVRKETLRKVEILKGIDY